MIYGPTTDADAEIALMALSDIAHWLGYMTESDQWASVYNTACADDPQEVRKRLREAK